MLRVVVAIDSHVQHPPKQRLCDGPRFYLCHEIVGTYIRFRGVSRQRSRPCTKRSSRLKSVLGDTGTFSNTKTIHKDYTVKGFVPRALMVWQRTHIETHVPVRSHTRGHILRSRGADNSASPVKMASINLD